MVALACLNSVNIPFTYQTDEEHHPMSLTGEPQGMSHALATSPTWPERFMARGSRA